MLYMVICYTKCSFLFIGLILLFAVRRGSDKRGCILRRCLCNAMCILSSLLTFLLLWRCQTLSTLKGFNGDKNSLNSMKVFNSALKKSLPMNDALGDRLKMSLNDNNNDTMFAVVTLSKNSLMNLDNVLCKFENCYRKLAHTHNPGIIFVLLRGSETANLLNALGDISNLAKRKVIRESGYEGLIRQDNFNISVVMWQELNGSFCLKDPEITGTIFPRLEAAARALDLPIMPRRIWKRPRKVLEITKKVVTVIRRVCSV